MSNVVPAVSYMYQWLGKNVKDGVSDILGRKVQHYEVHDGNMLYALTAHSTWARLYHPFALCSCQRGEGVVDPDHKCRMLSDEEHMRLFEKSHKAVQLRVPLQIFYVQATQIAPAPCGVQSSVFTAAARISALHVQATSH